MKVTIPINYNYINIQQKPHSTDNYKKRDISYSKPICCPAYFSPSFTAMKKKEFEGTDKLVVEKFKAPIQSFKTLNDFNDWANKRTKEIFEKDYTGRTTESTIQRKAMLGEWRRYIFEENKEYTPAQRLLIADGITKELSGKNDSIPPNLNKGVLADTVYNLKETLKNEPDKKEYNFNKTYQNNLRLFYTEDKKGSTGTDMTGWVVIPSKENDPEHFEENVEKLKTFSHPSWCTKSYNAEPYLSQGDFHVYLENGKPKLGIRFIGDEIEEIQGELNNTKIPFSHYDECVSYINKNNFTLSHKAEKEVQQGKIIRDKYSSLRNTIINAKNEEVIFNKIGIKTKKDKNNLLILSHFGKSQNMERDGISYDDLGINLDKLLKNVKEIKNYADFENLTIQSLPNLTKICGNANFNQAKISSMHKLESITENADFSYSNIKDLGALKEIGGNANFYEATIENLSALEAIRGSAYFTKAKIKNLSSLSYIGGKVTTSKAQIANRPSKPLDKISMKKYEALINASKKKDTEEIFKNLKIKYKINDDGTYTISHFSQTHEMKKDKITFKDLGINLDKLMENVSEIEKNADFSKTQITALPKLRTIGGNANFELSQINDLGNLKTIGGNANFEGSQINDLRNLKTIGGNAKFTHTDNLDLSSLEKIGGFGSFQQTSIKNLSNLSEIGGDAYFQSVSVNGGVPKLKTIKGNAHFYHATLGNLNSLETIEGYANFEETDIEELPNLTNINSHASFINSGIKRLPQLRIINGNASFENEEIDDMSSLEEIGKDAKFTNSTINNLSNLTIIHGDATCNNTKFENLNSLKTIKGDANFREIKIDKIPNLTEIEGNANLLYSDIKELPQLTTIGGNADFAQSKIINLNNLKTVNGNADFGNTKIKNLPNLETIHGNASFSWTNIDNLRKLKTIDGNAYFYGSKINNLSSLERIERSAILYKAEINNMKNIKYIGGKIELTQSKVKNQTHKYLKSISMQKFQPLINAIKEHNPEKIFKALNIKCKTNEDGTYTISHFKRTEEIQKCELDDKAIGLDLDELMENVTEIEGDADFTIWIKSKLNLPKLKRIGGNANFACLTITNMNELIEIGGNGRFFATKAGNLSELHKIGGDASFNEAEIKDLSGLDDVGGDADFNWGAKISKKPSLTHVKGKKNIEYFD